MPLHTPDAADRLVTLLLLLYRPSLACFVAQKNTKGPAIQPAGRAPHSGLRPPENPDPPVSIET